jgi:histidine triad (HIT) family protein
MPTIFSKIINGEIPCYKIAENDEFLAFLDISPLEKGHTLIVPKKEIDYIFDLEDDLLANMHLFSKKVARAIQDSVPCLRIGVAVIGLEVPHAHIHLVPLHSLGSMTFTKERINLSQVEFAEIAQSIRTKFEENI